MKYRCISSLEKIFFKYSFLSPLISNVHLNWNQLTDYKLKIENFSDVICNSPYIEKKLDEIEYLIKANKIKNNVHLLSTIIADLLFTSTCIISRYRGIFKNRQSIEVISHNQFVTFLDQLIEKRDILETTYFCHINSENYKTLNLPQRILILSLNSIIPQLRNHILNLPSFQSLLNKPYLIKWMFGSSGGLNQNYLNTCLAVTYAQNILFQVNDIISLKEIALVIYKIIQEKIENLIANGKAEQLNSPVFINGPSIYDECTRRLEKCLHELTELELNINTLLKEKRVSKRRLRTLKFRWSKIFQRLLSMANLFEPDWLKKEKPRITINSKQLIPGFWNLSFILTAIFSFIIKLIPLIDKPTAHERIKYGNISDKGSEALLKHIIHINATTEKTEHILTTSAKSIRKNFYKCKPVDFATIMTHLWESIAQGGGAQMARNTHGIFIRSIVHKNQKKFLIADPISKRLSIYGFNKLARLLRLEDYEIYLDVASDEQRNSFQKLNTSINTLSLPKATYSLVS